MIKVVCKYIGLEGATKGEEMMGKNDGEKKKTSPTAMLVCTCPYYS